MYTMGLLKAACASGGLALRQAVMAVASGYSDIVIAAGVEKMTDVSSGTAADALAAAADREWECFFGATFPALYAMMARLHMRRYGTTHDQMADVAVKNHHHACYNPIAQYQMEISVEDVNRSPMVADPLHILDCSPISDGAAAVVLAPTEMAKKLSESPIKVAASAQASDTLALHDRRMIDLDAAGLAQRRIKRPELFREMPVGRRVLRHQPRRPRIEAFLERSPAAGAPAASRRSGR